MYDDVPAGVPLNDEAEYNGPDLFGTPIGDEDTTEEDWAHTRLVAATAQTQTELRRALSTGISAADAARYEARFLEEMRQQREAMGTAVVAPVPDFAAAVAAATTTASAATATSVPASTAGKKRPKGPPPPPPRAMQMESGAEVGTLQHAEQCLDAMVALQHPQSYFMVTRTNLSGIRGTNMTEIEAIRTRKRNDEAKLFVRRPPFLLLQHDVKSPTSDVTPTADVSVWDDLQRSISTHSSDPPERIKGFLAVDTKTSESAGRLRATVARYLYLQQCAFEKRRKLYPASITANTFEEWISVKDKDFRERLLFGRMVDTAPNIIHLNSSRCTTRWWRVALPTIFRELLAFKEQSPDEFERIWVTPPPSITTTRSPRKPAAAAAAAATADNSTVLD